MQPASIMRLISAIICPVAYIATILVIARCGFPAIAFG